MTEKYQCNVVSHQSLEVCRKLAHERCRELRREGWSQFSISYRDVLVSRAGSNGYRGVIRCRRWGVAL